MEVDKYVSQITKFNKKHSRYIMLSYHAIHISFHETGSNAYIIVT